MRNKIENQEFQWVVRFIEKIDQYEDEQQYEKVFATEEEALNELKESYEYGLKNFRIFKSYFESNRAGYYIRYYNKVDGYLQMYIVKEKTNYLDMTIAEYYNKVSFIYGEKEGLSTSADSGESHGFLSHFCDEDWTHISPYSEFYIRGYWYAPHPDDCCYNISGKGIAGDYFKSYSRHTKMSEVIQDIKNEDAEYCDMVLTNIKQITDAGGKYLIDAERNYYEYFYVLCSGEFQMKSLGNHRAEITAKK